MTSCAIRVSHNTICRVPRAGIFRENDTLTHLNGVPAADVEALTGIISGVPVGDTRFQVRRGAQTEVILTPEPGGTPARISP
jgi:hypothetical protein